MRAWRGSAIARKEATRAVLGFLDTRGNAGAQNAGRAWRTDELRLKGFEDLQKLWFVCVKERNLLDTEKDWCRSNRRHWVGGESKLSKLRQTMARIQTVIGERANAYLRVQMDLKRVRTKIDGQHWDEKKEQIRHQRHVAYLKRTHAYEGLAILVERLPPEDEVKAASQ